MESDSDLVKIVRGMIIGGKSSADFQFLLEDIPFVVTVSISSPEDKKPDE